MKVLQINVVRAWNNKINHEIAKLYTVRTNVTLLLRNNESMEQILEPEIQTIIDKLQSLILEEENDNPWQKEAGN
jgi:hypothetical protein